MKRRQEWDEKKKELAELAEAKKAEEVRELEEENKVFLEFCQEYEKGQEEDQGQVQVAGRVGAEMRKDPSKYGKTAYAKNVNSII